MTRLAVLSDIHGDLHALQDALGTIKRIGCDAVVCAGDLVDFGLFPAEVIELLMAHEIPCVRGNHERDAVETGASQWDLSPVALRFLRNLPAGWDAVFGGVRVAVRHASPTSDLQGIDPARVTPAQLRQHLDAAAADVLLVGHTHVAFRFETERGIVANPGAVLRDPGQPLDIPTPGTLGVLELPSRLFTVHLVADGQEVEIVRRLPSASVEPKNQDRRRLARYSR